MFTVGEKVEYDSASNKAFVQMTVIAAHADGSYDLSGKKGASASKIRRVGAEAAAPIAASGPAVGGSGVDKAKAAAASGPAVGGNEVDKAKAGPATPSGTGGGGSGGAAAEQPSGRSAGSLRAAR